MNKTQSLIVSFVLFLFITPASFAAEVSSSSSSDTSSDQQNVAENEDHQAEKKSLEISDVWARKSMSSNNNSAVYMKINNPTEQQITIIAASASRVANNVELHKSFVDEKGVSRMKTIDKIVVPAQSSIELKPGGIHIMLFDLKRSLSPADKFTIDIKMDGIDPISVESVVK